jgi:putative transposase
MPALEIRTDLSAAELRQHAKREKDPRVARRLLAIANALDGMSRELSAKLAGMDRQALRDWVIRYNADGIAGLKDRWGDGRPMSVTEGELAAVKHQILKAASARGDADRPALRIIDVSGLIEERTGVRYSISGTHRIMRSLNLSHQKTRAQHPQADPRAQRAFKKTSRSG